MDKPGVATKRTVLNVFGSGGHGGRYILDSLKVCMHPNTLFLPLNAWG